MLDVVLVVATALLLFGLAAALLRRSLIGVVIGIELGAGALVLFAVALFDLSGTSTSTGQVVAAALVAFAVAAAGLVAALHVAGERARRRTSDLEPW